MIGTKIENYRITSVLGEGGMGVVYKAFDLKLERYVALKILNQKAVSNPQFVERFKREAKNQAQLSHPNIVPVYGFADDQNFLGFVMEYVNGETLENRIEKKGKIDLYDALEVMKQILGGAAFAHTKGFIHRDLKPSNVIFTQDGIAKIMDFGISKSINESKSVTKSSVKIGTLLYMSPEQLKGFEPTIQSDIYALGIIFYEMLLGRNPFDGKSDFQIMEAHLKKYPPRLGTLIADLPEEIDRIIFKAMSKSTDKRYKDALEFYHDIDQEIVRLKSEQRRTREILVKRKLKKEILNKVKNYLIITAGVLFSAAVIYFAYSYIEKYFNLPPGASNPKSVIRDSEHFKFVNSGWKKVAIPVSESLTAIKFLGSKGVICGFNGTLLLSEDKGSHWETVNTSTADNFYSVNLLNNEEFLITGEHGSIYKYNVFDHRLRKIPSPVNESLFDSYFLKGNQYGFLCGGKGTILKTTDGGESWVKINSGTEKLLYSIYFSGSKGFAVGWDGEFIITSNNGSNWDKLQLPTVNYLRDILFIDANIGFVVGGEGEIFRTSDLGVSWNKVNSGVHSGLYLVSFRNNEDGYILGNGGEILFSDDKGESWQLTSTGSHLSLTDIEVADDNSFFVTGYNGTLLVSK